MGERQTGRGKRPQGTPVGCQNLQRRTKLASTCRPPGTRDRKPRIQPFGKTVAPVVPRPSVLTSWALGDSGSLGNQSASVARSSPNAAVARRGFRPQRIGTFPSDTRSCGFARSNGTPSATACCCKRTMARPRPSSSWSCQWLAGCTTSGTGGIEAQLFRSATSSIAFISPRSR